MVVLATASAASIAEIEFAATVEIPDPVRDMLSEAREGITEISWILWGVSIALESPEAVMNRIALVIPCHRVIGSDVRICTARSRGFPRTFLAALRSIAM